MTLGVIIIKGSVFLSPLGTVGRPVASEIVPAAVNFHALICNFFSIYIVILISIFLFPAGILDKKIKIRRAVDTRYRAIARTLPHAVFALITALGIILCYPTVPF